MMYPAEARVSSVFRLPIKLTAAMASIFIIVSIIMTLPALLDYSPNEGTGRFVSGFGFVTGSVGTALAAYYSSMYFFKTVAIFGQMLGWLMAGGSTRQAVVLLIGSSGVPLTKSLSTLFLSVLATVAMFYAAHMCSRYGRCIASQKSLEMRLGVPASSFTDPSDEELAAV